MSALRAGTGPDPYDWSTTPWVGGHSMARTYANKIISYWKKMPTDSIGIEGNTLSTTTFRQRLSCTEKGLNSVLRKMDS